MNVNCIICSDLFSPSDEIFATRCGHAFHQTCLLQWIERSKSCPQCRAKTTDKTIFRIYFNILNTEGITLDAGTLQAKLDNVEFQSKQKDKEIKQQKDENQKLQQQCSKSEEILLNTKEKLKSKEVAIVGLKEQIDYLKVECNEVTQLRNEKENLQKSMVILKGLELIIYGTASEVEEMVKCQTDMTAMCTYVTALKRASTDLHNKKKRLQESVRTLQNQLSKANNDKMDQQTKMVTLEDSLSHAENEIKQLKAKVNELESQLQSNSSNNKNVEIIVDLDFSLEEKCKRKLDIIEDQDCPSAPKSRKLYNNEANEELQLKKTKISQQSSDLNHSLIKGVQSTKESQSPYLNLKRCSALAGFQLKKSVSAPYATAKSTEFSIFKTNRLSEKMKSENNGDLYRAMIQKRKECETAYDGLGGHSKPDIFPVATKKHPFTTTKKLTMKDKLKRLERPANQATIENTLKKK